MKAKIIFPAGLLASPPSDVDPVWKKYGREPKNYDFVRKFYNLKIISIHKIKFYGYVMI